MFARFFFLTVLLALVFKNALAIERIIFDQPIDQLMIKVTSDKKNKIIIQSIDSQGYAKQKRTACNEKVIWDFTYDDIPVSKDDCELIDAISCEDSTFWKNSCHKNCMIGVPELLGFDKKNGIVYLSEMTSNVGTGGGDFFLISANIKSKTIKLLNTVSGPHKGMLSPSGDYLLFYGYGWIGIYNTITNEKSTINNDSIWMKKHERLHSLGNVKWLSNTRFSYTDISYIHGRADEIRENIYDIPSQKIIESRLLTS